MTLKQLPIASRAKITSVGGEDTLRRHLLDMGVIPGAEITVVKYAPMGDPIEVRIHGYELTLRLSEAENIQAEQISDEVTDDNEIRPKKKYNQHPGIGEDGVYHIRTGKKPLDKNARLTFALVGNQNCGKTTLFNRLTGANQHVGNFPGVTVERKTGSLKGKPNTEITDLPGIYSMSPYSSEELLTREFIMKEKPDCIINIVDATNIERNLFLTMQLMELDMPMVLALNMMDEIKSNGGAVYINDLEAMLGIPVVPISAMKNEGVDEIINHAMHIARYNERPGRIDFCDKSHNGGAVHRCLHGIINLIDDHAEAAGIPLRFAASKLIDGDAQVLQALKLSDNEKEMLEHIISQLETESGFDRMAAMADMRFAFITKLCSATVIKPKESRQRERSRRIDKILTGKYTAFPAFGLIMAIIFCLTFATVGVWLQDLMSAGIDSIALWLEGIITDLQINSIIHSLLIDGIIAGVGSVLSFLPMIIVLFFFLAILEDSGYMARIAFVMDKPLRKIGLSGRSIVSMLIGFGCTVPAVMASRTLPSARDRKMTVLLTPFMSCTAKLPIYAFFADAFFPDSRAVVVISLYFIGVVVSVVAAAVLRKTVFKGEAVPFVMELPEYRMPSAKNVILLLWDKAKDFIERAFTVIFVASIVIWFLQTFDFKLNVAVDSQRSMLAGIAGAIAPVFMPLGFGDWRVVTSLVAGFMAKESVVSTLTLLCGSAGVMTLLTKDAVWPLLIFCLLYTPCVAAVSAIKRELGGKWAVAVVAGQCLIAWVCAFIAKIINLIIYI